MKYVVNRKYDFTQFLKGETIFIVFAFLRVYKSRNYNIYTYIVGYYATVI